MYMEPVVIAGVELNQEKFPALFEWAHRSPETLDKQLRGLISYHGAPSTQDAAEILEEDLKDMSKAY